MYKLKELTHLTVHVTDTQRGKEFITQLTSHPRRKKMVTNPYCADFWIALVIKQINIGWDGEHCKRYDAIAAKDHSCIATSAERNRREMLALNSSGPNGPMNQREGYHEAIKIKERSHGESGNSNTRLHPSEQVRKRPS